ncbi:MAG TPA: glycosyltransferase [Thermoanaerobaculia bacterium]|nr:glycosyltransferase [Thermoanaerobaculia bacterium]
MRIGIFPGYDESGASSRIRAYTLQRSLNAIGHDARLWNTNADAVLLQKKLRAPTLSAILNSISPSATVVYDADDGGRALWYPIAPSTLRKVMIAADVVTTDTAGHREWLLQCSPRAVEIIPDCVDYDPKGPVRSNANPGALRILWFGHMTNIALFSRHVQALSSVRGAELVAVTNASAIADLSSRFPSVSFVPWSRATFLDVLRSCTASVLSHDGTALDYGKSNNRMITSITWGVPAIVSRTPEYERTAREAGVEDAVFSNDNELLAIVERLRTEAARRQYLDAAQPVVWERYSPEAVARQFCRMLERVKENRIPSRVPGYFSWLGRAAQGHVAAALAFEAAHFARRWKRADLAPLVPSLREGER